MSVNQKFINEWLIDHNLELYPFFTDKLRDLAFPYSKSMI